MIDVGPYEACRLAGVIQRLRIDPEKASIEVDVADATAVVSAVWHIRRPTPQLALVPGRGVVLTGVARVGSSGTPILLEPSFELVRMTGEAAA